MKKVSSVAVTTKKKTKYIRFRQKRYKQLQNIVNIDNLIPFAGFCVLKYCLKRFSMILTQQFSIRSQPVHRF